MNILLVHNFYQQPGGEDQVFADEGKLLEQHGHEVARFTMHNDAVEGMGKFALAKKTIWNKPAQQSLRQAIRNARAEVVHFHNTFPLISPAAYYTAHEEECGVVQTLHNFRLLCPGATMFRDGKVCEECMGRWGPWPGVVHGCYRDNRMASAAVAAMITFHRKRGTWRKQVDVYIALSQFARNKFIQGGLPGEKIVVKPNFVDADLSVGSGEGGFALFVGRLTEEKGIATLLRAWKHLSDRTGLTLKIAGDGPMRDSVIEATKTMTRIEFIGRQPSNEIYDMMGRATALIFPSIWYEGQPKTMIEAMAKGMPIVASRLGTMAEMIDDGKNGLLFTPGDAEDLSRQMQRLLEDAPMRQKMRAAARNEFENRYTADKNYPQLLAIYERAKNAVVNVKA
jgi:glycosyltransferase involved in cell wall biosynthesis